MTKPVVIAPIVFSAIGFGIAYGLYATGDKAAATAKISALAVTGGHWQLLSGYVFTRLVSFLNFYPVLYKSQVAQHGIPEPHCHRTPAPRRPSRHSARPTQLTLPAPCSPLSQVMRGNSGNMRANMMVYEQVGESANHGKVVLVEGGDLGRYAPLSHPDFSPIPPSSLSLGHPLSH
jgi:hypothetical protein